MIDIDRQIASWRDGAEEDFTVARELLDGGRVRHGLFFAHPALEKALKANVCRRTRDLPPRIHNLVRLARLADVNANEEQVNTLAEMNAFSVEARYPESALPSPTLDEARAYFARATEVFRWLMSLS